MSMKTRDEKEKKRDLFTTIFWILVLVFLIVKIVIPETGVLGMVNEGSNAVLFFGIGGSCVWTIIHKRKTNKTAVVFGVLLLVLILGIGGWISGKLVLDLISGPEVVRLTSGTSYIVNAFPVPSSSLSGTPLYADWNNSNISLFPTCR